MFPYCKVASFPHVEIFRKRTEISYLLNKPDSMKDTKKLKFQLYFHDTIDYMRADSAIGFLNFF